MRSRAPGAALLHPLAGLCLVTLLTNDHWLKHAHPGFLSGKLSDFAAVFLLPVLLHALFELSYFRATRRVLSGSQANRALVVCLTVTLLVYAPPELWKPAETAYRYGVGGLQWPFRALAALLLSDALPALRPVRATADVSDLSALVMLWPAWRVARRSNGSQPSCASLRAVKLSVPLLVMLAALSVPAAAAAASHSEPYSHDGFYMSFELGGELLLLHSSASVSNGFQQPIASSATGFAPGGTLEIGGTPCTGLVLGGNVASAQFQDPIIDTLGTRFTLRNTSLDIFQLGAFAKYYPDRIAGFNVELGAGAMGLEANSIGGAALRGPYFTLAVGQGLWLARQWSLAASLRVTAADLIGDVPGATLLLIPGVFATIACH
jgi:hypothetical protein